MILMKFPSPLEVDRFLYGIAEGRYYRYTSSFPAPLEVDKVAIQIEQDIETHCEISFRPLPR